MSKLLESLLSPHADFDRETKRLDTGISPTITETIGPIL